MRKWYSPQVALSVGAMLLYSNATIAQQDYPTKPIRFIVPFAAGGSVDIVSRIVADQLAEDGLRLVQDYHPGVGGTIGVELASRAEPDGYTLVVGTLATHVIAPYLFSKLRYDPIKDFAPVTVLAYLPNILVVHPSLPVTNVKQLIALAKAHPRELNYGSSGVGTVQHLGAVMLETMAGIKMTHIPYRSGAPAIADLLGGHISIMFTTVPVAVPQLKSGRLRAIAVTSVERAKALPAVPTIADSGVSGYDAATWYALWFPAKTPRNIVDRIYGDVARALKTPVVTDRLVASGGEPGGETPQQFAAQIEREQARWAPIVRRTKKTAG